MTAQATEPEAINYGRDVGWSGSVMAELVRGAPSTVIVTFNYDDRPQIGCYRCVLPESRFGQALNDLRISRYREIDPGDNFPPESKFVTVGERAAGERLPQIRSYEIRTLPPAIGKLATAIEGGVVNEIRTHPLRVVEGQAAWQKPSFSPAEPLTTTVTLKSVGALPLTLGTPLGHPPADWSGVRLWIDREDGAGKQQVVDLTATHLRPAPDGPASPLVSLDPGGIFRFTVKKRVFLSPGRYKAQLSYTILSEAPDDAQFISGELWLPLGPLEITPPWR